MERLREAVFFELAGADFDVGRQLPSEYGGFPGTGSYPGQHRFDFVAFFFVATCTSENGRD